MTPQAIPEGRVLGARQRPRPRATEQSFPGKALVFCSVSVASGKPGPGEHPPFHSGGARGGAPAAGSSQEGQDGAGGSPGPPGQAVRQPGTTSRLRGRAAGPAGGREREGETGQGPA